MTATKHVATIAVAMAFSATSAFAQNINFTTSGAFTGTGCVELQLEDTFTSCTVAGGVQVRFDFGEEQVLDGFGNAQFGAFTTSGSGPSTFSDVLFALTINQTSPTVGSSSVNAQVYGDIAAIQGGLIWGPIDPTTFSIGQVNYTISVDEMTAGVRIAPPGLGGTPSSPQTIRGFVTTTAVPEPSTYALMLLSLVGLTVAARRRRSA